MNKPSRDSVPCGGCGSVYSEGGWRALPSVETLREVDIRRHVVAWPEGRAVEVRACQKCGRSIARLGPKRVAPFAATG